MAYANSADQNQTAPTGSTLFATQLSIIRNSCIESKIQAKKKKKWNKVFEILGHLVYFQGKFLIC